MPKANIGSVKRQLQPNCNQEDMSSRYTLLDIPAEFQYESERLPFAASIHRLVVGVCQDLGVLESLLGLHLVQAGFQLRFAMVARELRENALSLQKTLHTEAQMTALAAFQLALVSSVAVLDLGAAALVGLAGYDLSSSTPDLRDIAEKRRKKLPSLSEEREEWIAQTRSDSEWLYQVRDAVVHRHVPVHVTIGAHEPYELTINGKRAPVRASVDK